MLLKSVDFVSVILITDTPCPQQIEPILKKWTKTHPQVYNLFPVSCLTDPGSFIDIRLYVIPKFHSIVIDIAA